MLLPSSIRTLRTHFFKAQRVHKEGPALYQCLETPLFILVFRIHGELQPELIFSLRGRFPAVLVRHFQSHLLSKHQKHAQPEYTPLTLEKLALLRKYLCLKVLLPLPLVKGTIPLVCTQPAAATLALKLPLLLVQGFTGDKCQACSQFIFLYCDIQDRID